MAESFRLSFENSVDVAENSLRSYDKIVRKWLTLLSLSQHGEVPQISDSDIDDFLVERFEYLVSTNPQFKWLTDQVKQVEQEHQNFAEMRKGFQLLVVAIMTVEDEYSFLRDEITVFIEEEIKKIEKQWSVLLAQAYQHYFGAKGQTPVDKDDRFLGIVQEVQRKRMIDALKRDLRNPLDY